MFIYEKCSYMKFVHILKLFIFRILKIVHIFKFSNLFIFRIFFNFEIIHILIFLFKLKNCSYFKIYSNLKKEKKTCTVNLVGCGPTRHPRRAGYAAPRSRAANRRRIGASAARSHTLVENGPLAWTL
jgi:hypothetical protein